VFGRKKPRKDLPAIDISKKKEKGLFGKTKIVPRSKKEQRKLKTELLKIYPDRFYIDDLGEYNSIKPRDELSWIDDIEAFEAFMD
jgi:hypothetical protein